jgi:peptidoglycan/xylan/chitin deacetylase (PgdA/CDA1 family)
MGQSKRDRVASLAVKTGLRKVLGAAPQKHLLLVLNYHRIWHPVQTGFDPGVFSATVESLDFQCSHVKKYYRWVGLDEAIAIAEGREKTPGMSVLMTYDDGYIDNYTLAYPVLKSHGVQGVFFLITSYVGSTTVPWWDQIAFLLRTTLETRIALTYPEPAEFDLSLEQRPASLQEILRLYKSPRTEDPERFLIELRQACRSKHGIANHRRFLDWHEAREMLRGGMAFGVHTHTHPLLAKLAPSEQARELTTCCQIFEERLKVPGDVLAYLVGSREAFDSVTQRVLGELGFRAAFSFYGGLNRPAATSRFDIRRVSIHAELAPERFEFQTQVAALTGDYWF